MRHAWIPCALSLGLAVAACGGKNSGDDDDSAGASGAGTGAIGGTSGGGSGGGSGSGGSSAKGGGGGTGAVGGTSSGGTGGGLTMPLSGGPHPFPMNKKPQYCDLTTFSGASTAVQSAYSYWKTTYVVASGAGMRVQRPENQNDTVSEGIGYGMLIAVYMNDRPTFDAIWAYGKQHLDSSGLMNWHLNADGTIASGGMGSATDADEDMAYVLIMASSQWSSGTYLDDGRKLAKAILANEVIGDGMLKPGDSWGGDTTYPDYFSPSYFRVFMRDDVAAGNKANWQTVIKRNYEILANVTGQYGLVPDSTTSTYDLSKTYKYDACRTPWRIGMDYCFYGTPEAKTYLDKIGAFFDGQGVANIGDAYSLTGAKTSPYQNMAFIGPAGVAGMAGFPKLLNDAFAFGANGTGGSQQYFQQSLRVITMLMMSGNFVDYTLP